ncbi:hypothetical protein [Paenibacillus lentus]|uniref:hypothetical protein n=1 Tax=Paenibacillus lentus TaxID=1338368 RepID=UPI001B85E5CD|nr:hypothetical protein [Paenibacillus lentus]
MLNEVQQPGGKDMYVMVDKEYVRKRHYVDGLGHVRGFQYFGGVLREGLYDNAKTQVVKILSGPDCEEH